MTDAVFMLIRERMTEEKGSIQTQAEQMIGNGIVGEDGVLETKEEATGIRIHGVKTRG